MAHVGVERFDAGHREHDRAERDERDIGVVDDEAHRVRRDRAPRAPPGPRMISSAPSTPSVDEPQHHHRPEHRAEPAPSRGAGRRTARRRITMLTGTMNGCSAGRDDAEALDRAEHGDRRRDHAVAVEHRRAEDAEPDQPPAQPRAVLDAARHERRQREDAALAAVVGAHDQRDVLERDDDHQRPEDHRQDAEHVVVRRATGRTGR